MDLDCKSSEKLIWIKVNIFIKLKNGWVQGMIIATYTLLGKCLAKAAYIFKHLKLKGMREWRQLWPLSPDII